MTHGFSSAYEEWQNRIAGASINSIKRLDSTVMAESGLGGGLWFKAAEAGVDAWNITFKEPLKETSWTLMYGEPKDVSLYRPFGCREWVHLNSERREKRTPQAL